MPSKSGIDVDDLKRYMKVPALEKLRHVSRRQEFARKLLTPQRSKIQQLLQAQGF